MDIAGKPIHIKDTAPAAGKWIDLRGSAKSIYIKNSGGEANLYLSFDDNVAITGNFLTLEADDVFSLSHLHVDRMWVKGNAVNVTFSGIYVQVL
jgi:hypothetical protein